MIYYLYIHAYRRTPVCQQMYQKIIQTGDLCRWLEAVHSFFYYWSLLIYPDDEIPIGT